jgi:ATP-dependent helicase HrpA
MAEIGELEAEYDGLRDALAPSSELEEIGWMLQELRVSLFAQPLGTRGKVSPKRVRKAMAEIAGLG